MYKRKKTLHQCLIVALMLVLCVIFLVPILWVFFSSFKSASELFVWPPTLVGSNPTLNNYTTALQQGNFDVFFLNTAFVSIMATFLTVVVNVMSGYAFAKYDFKGKKILFVLVMATLMVPLEVIMIPIFKVIVGTGLYDSLWGLIRCRI